MVFLGASSAARAQAPDAKELYKRATAHFNLGRFKEAAAEYEQVFETHPDPVILYNIAQSYRLAGGYDEKALFFYKSYMRGNPKAPNREEVQQRIAALEESVAQQKKNQQTPPNNTLERPPEKPGEAAPAAAASAPAPAAAPSVAASAEQKPAPTPVYKKWWLWTIVGVAAAGVGLGVGLGLGLSSSSSFNGNLPEGGPGARSSALVSF
jgi:tetratricopeptide (TPR) repeat protein